MREMTRGKELGLAVVLSFALVWVIGTSMSQMAVHGGRFLSVFPPADARDQILEGALAMFIFGATDWPAAFRRSQRVRTQFQCWSIWLFLLAVLYTVNRSWLSPPVLLAFAVAFAVLAMYSLVALYTPRDLF